MEYVELINNLKNKAYKLSFTVGGLPQQRAADKNNAERIAHTLGANTKAISTKWRIFNPEHPLVAELMRALNDLRKFRDGFISADKLDASKLIWAEDHAHIYSEVCRLDAEVKRIADKVDQRLDEIKEVDRANAAALWRADVYPQVPIKQLVGVPHDSTGPIIKIEPLFVIPEGLQEEIKKTIAKRIELKLASDISEATNSSVLALQESITTFLEELNNKTVLQPVAGFFDEYTQASPEVSVLKTETNNENKEIPVGYIRCFVEYKVKTKTVVDDKEVDVLTKKMEWTKPITLDEYRNYARPFSVKKKIYSSVIDNVIEQINRFKKYQKDLLGDYGTDIDRRLDSLLDFLKSHLPVVYNATTGEVVADTLRNRRNISFKDKLRDILADTLIDLKVTADQAENDRRRYVSSLEMFEDENEKN
jgi:hypothetical protein